MKAKSSSWAQVDALRKQVKIEAQDQAPEGAFTGHAYAAQYGIPYQTAVTQIARMVAAHVLIAGSRLELDSGGRKRLLKVYWPA